jgi:enoyl-CoA hydratase
MAGEDILLSKYGKALTLTLNRPERLNVLDNKLIEELIDLIKSYENDENIRVIVLRGAGGKAFCAGVDINYLSGLKTSEERRAFSLLADELFFLIEFMGKVFIAAIDGYCLGGGLELAMACDIRIATKNSSFGLPETKLGIIPGGGGTQRFPQIVGVQKAKELLFTSDIVGADEAFRLGILNDVTGNDKLAEKVDELVGKISANSFKAVRASKMAINRGVQLSGYKLENRFFVRSFEHPDQKEGMSAFLGKRIPKFE